MHKYVAAALSIAVAIGPASALDVGLGGKVGGIGVGAGLGVGSKGASVGVDANVDGVAGANAGASVGKSNGSLGASVGVSGNVGSASGGLSAGIGVGDKSSGGGGAGTTPGDTAGGSAAGSGSAGSGSVGTGAAPGGAAGDSAAGSGSAGSGGAGKKTAAIALTKGVRQSIVLPRILRPSRAGHDNFGRSTKGYPLLRFQAPFKAIPGTPPAVVRVCRQAIASAATPLGAVRVRAASAGPLRRQRLGALTAPIEVRIDYARQGGIEVRQARVGCRLDAAGRVVAVIQGHTSMATTKDELLLYVLPQIWEHINLIGTFNWSGKSKLPSGTFRSLRIPRSTFLAA